MKAMLTLLTTILLAAPAGAGAFPIRVDFSIFRSFATWPADQERIPEVGNGYFIFDSGVFPGPQEPWYTAAVGGPAGAYLQDLSIDYMGRHWALDDAETVALAWDYRIPADRLPQADWGPFNCWELKGADWAIPGADQGSFGSLNGEDVTVWWDVTTPEPALAMAEPPSLLLFGLGLAALGAARRFR